MKLKIKPFKGLHCETTATGTLLKQQGLKISEPMLFGIGEGLSYIYWSMKNMPRPFIGGRVKPDQLTENICRNLGATLNVKTTSSAAKALANITEPIDRGMAVGLKLDCYHLEYFTKKIHFAGHYAAFYGYDKSTAFLVDTEPQGSFVQTSLASLAQARSEKGPMSSPNLSYTIELPPIKDTQALLKKIIPKAVGANAREFINPPITNIGYKGIAKTAKQLPKWFASSKDVAGDFTTTAMLMERAGTGGAVFRNLYRDFLNEAYRLTEKKALQTAHSRYKEIAKHWTQVSELFDKAGQTSHEGYILEAADLLTHLSELEHQAMSDLAAAFSK